MQHHRRLLAALTLITASAAHAQNAPLEIDLKVGATRYIVRGQGECKAQSQASIYGLAAAMHMVSHRAGKQSLRLTVWQPKDGSAAMMGLSVSEGRDRFEVDTVKAGTKRDTRGSGKVAFEAAGAGGVFRIDAVAATGEKVTGTIRCARFGGIQAEGG